jgi:hypothetical protein
MQTRAEEIVDFYCVSDAGLTIYSGPRMAEIGFREGKADVSELFPSEFLLRNAEVGLAPPKGELREKAEVCMPLSTSLFHLLCNCDVY